MSIKCNINNSTWQNSGSEGKVAQLKVISDQENQSHPISNTIFLLPPVISITCVKINLRPK